MEIQRKSDESKLEYVKRIVYGKLVDKTIDDDYTVLAPLVFGKSYSSDVARRMFYGARDILQLVDNDKTSNIDDDNILKEIELKRVELEKEKIRVQDQKREYKNLLRPQARFERLVEVLEENLIYIEPFEIGENTYEYNSDDKVEAVLMASDWHIDSKFDNALGCYNIDIAKRRINELLNKTIKYCKINNVSTLHLELLGDNISGGIHWSSKVESEEDVISQVITLSELLGTFISELSKQIPNIKIYSVIGNHSRINMMKENNQKGENLERLIPYYLKLRLNNINNIEVMDYCNLDDGIIEFDVLGTKIVGVHGDLDNPSNVVNNIIKMFKIIPKEIHMGHRHHHYENEEYDIETSINGCLQGTDTYAFNIRKSGKPMQKLNIYNEDGRLCTYKIKLD